MRLASLTLARYGAFTDRVLAFDPAARLHVVYGPNEAGKSTVLAALADLLFGFEKASPYGFLHKSADLRLGAEVRGGSGSGSLAFERRKSSRLPLADAAGAALGEDALRPFLGGLERPGFLRSFGLNAAALRAGADELLSIGAGKDGGLLAAASGLGGLKAVAGQLGKEAGELWGRKGAGFPLNKALERRDALRRDIRNSEVGAAAWNGLLARLDGETRRLEGLRGERAALEAERRLLTDFSAARDAAARAGDDLGKAQAAAGAEQAAATLIVVDAPLLQRAAEISGLRDTSAYAKAREDAPAVSREAEAVRAEMQQRAVSLGLASADALEERQPSDPARERVRQLVAAGNRLGTDGQTLDGQLATERDALADFERDSAAEGALTDPAGLRAGFDALETELRDIGRRREIELEISKEQRLLAAAAAALNPPVPDLDSFVLLLRPSAETVARFEQESADLADEKKAAKRAREEALAALGAAQARLADLTRDGVPVTRADVTRARAARDSGFVALRPALDGGKISPGVISLYEGAVLAADRAADDFASAADLAAKVAAGRDAMAEAERRLVRAETELQDIAGRVEAGRRRWQAEWSACGLDPRPAKEMAAWLAGFNGVLTARGRLGTLRDTHASLDARAERILPVLTGLARQAGVAMPGQSDVASLEKLVEARIAALQKRWNDSRELEGKRRDCEARLERFRRKRAAVAEQVVAWKAQWQEALPVIGVAASSGIAEAETALEIWKSVPALIEKRDGLEARVKGMRRDMQAVEDKAVALFATVDPELGRAELVFAVGELVARFQHAREADTARRHQVLRVAEAVKAREAALAHLREAEATYAELNARVPRETDAAQRLAGIEVAHAALDGEIIRVSGEQKALDLERKSKESGQAIDAFHAELRQLDVEIAALARQWSVLRIGRLMAMAALQRLQEAEEGRFLARAAALFCGLTGGRFTRLHYQFETAEPVFMARRASGEDVPVAQLGSKLADALSEGSRDQLYLALRLAFLEEYAAHHEPVPFVCDDIFATFDDDRTAHALAALAALSPAVQPIVFTHHRSVVETARARLGADVDVITL